MAEFVRMDGPASPAAEQGGREQRQQQGRAGAGLGHGGEVAAGVPFQDGHRRGFEPRPTGSYSMLSTPSRVQRPRSNVGSKMPRFVVVRSMNCQSSRPAAWL